MLKRRAVSRENKETRIKEYSSGLQTSREGANPRDLYFQFYTECIDEKRNPECENSFVKSEAHVVKDVHKPNT